MRGAPSAGCAGVLFVLASSAVAHAKPPVAKPPRSTTPPVHTDARPAAPLPMLPSVARVRVEAARDRVVVVEEVNLPRGDWRAGGLDLYVAFGAPGTPAAIDARLLTVPADSIDPQGESVPSAHAPASDDSGEALVVEPAVRRMPTAQLLLGRPQMAGAVVHIKEADLRHAYGASDLAAVRIRTLLSPPAADLRGERDVVVRLGIVGDLPLTLGRVQVVSLEGPGWIARAEANLCGPEAEGLPLAVSVIPKAERPLSPAPAWSGGVGPIVPAMAVRHASDDLCIRWWASP
jgi:hypothetical protein